MGSELLLAAAAPPARSPPIITTTTTTTGANGITTTTRTTSPADGTTTITTTTTRKRSKTTSASAADGTTTTTATTTTSTANATISSVGQGLILEIFLRLPNLPDLVRAALTCRSWLHAVRSSPSFRRLFRTLHLAPLIGLFANGATAPSFAPLRRSDPDVKAALRRGDFFLTSLPTENDAPADWSFTDCCDGYILLWNMLSVAAVNPMTWAVDIIPLPDDVAGGSLGDFLGFHLLSSEENPSSFRVMCVCADVSRVRAAVFSSETWHWVVHPWVHIGGHHSLKYCAGTLVDGSVYWPLQGEARMIRINTATMDITNVDLPSQVMVKGCNFKAGETKDGQLCIVYASDDSLLHVWNRSVDGDGIEIWVPHNIHFLGEEIDRITEGLEGRLRFVQVRSGYVYLSMTCMTPVGTPHCWFLSLPLETMELELLIEGTFGGCAYPYAMACPPSLIGDDDWSIGHEVESSH